MQPPTQGCKSSHAGPWPAASLTANAANQVKIAGLGVIETLLKAMKDARVCRSMRVGR